MDSVLNIACRANKLPSCLPGFGHAKPHASLGLRRYYHPRLPTAYGGTDFEFFDTPKREASKAL
jgi:hypothetical protein